MFHLAVSVPRPWNEFLGESDVAMASIFSVGAMAAAWVIRRGLCRGGIGFLAINAVLLQALGTLFVAALLLLWVYAKGDSIEEIESEYTAGRKLLWSVYCVLHMAIRGWAWAARVAYLALPACIGAVICLRWSQGPRSRPLRTQGRAGSIS